MSDPTRPFLVVYIIWHPGFHGGAEIAEALREHFRRKLYENVTGGTGLSVIFRSEPAPGCATPLPINLDEARTTAIVVLVEPNLARDSAWVRYVRELVEHTEAAGLGSRVFPVTLEQESVLAIKLDERGFPYMGNVPIVRMDPRRPERIDFVVGRLLDEVLKNFLWLCRLELWRATAGPAVMFVPRPPELISLAGLPKATDVSDPVIVYPDPPLSTEEERLFEDVAPRGCACAA